MYVVVVYTVDIIGLPLAKNIILHNIIYLLLLTHIIFKMYSVIAILIRFDLLILHIAFDEL
jgi:hypothetical protein